MEEAFGEKKKKVMFWQIYNLCQGCYSLQLHLHYHWQVTSPLPFKNSDLKGSSGYFVELRTTFQHSDIHSLESAALPCSVSVIWRSRTGPLPSKEWGHNRIAKFCSNIPRKTQEMTNKAVGRRSTSFLSLPACPKETSSVPCEVKGKSPFCIQPYNFGHRNRRKRQQPLFCTDNRKARASSSPNLCSSHLNLSVSTTAQRFLEQKHCNHAFFICCWQEYQAEERL